MRKTYHTKYNITQTQNIDNKNQYITYFSHPFFMEITLKNQTYPKMGILIRRNMLYIKTHFSTQLHKTKILQ